MGLRSPTIQPDPTPADSPPTVSVVIPSLNQAQHLEAAILSVTSQDYPNKECIVIDGGSTDGSMEIMRRHQDRLTHWTSEADQGQAHAIRKGLSRSGGGVLSEA
jgi:glycosyltransferase involved in cell wall biosynthesis